MLVKGGDFNQCDTMVKEVQNWLENLFRRVIVSESLVKLLRCMKHEIHRSQTMVLYCIFINALDTESLEYNY